MRPEPTASGVLLFGPVASIARWTQHMPTFSGSGKSYVESFGGGVAASGRGSIAGGSLAIGLNVRFDHKLSELFAQMGEKRTVYALSKAVDEVGAKTRTQVIRAVAKQAGVKYGRAKSVISSKQAMGAGAGDYEIIARDVTLSLKEFAPRQTAAGVSAAPWGKRRVFAHTFIGPNGHIFVRAMQGNKRVPRLPIHKLWGPAIPKEMVKGETERVFYDSVDALFPAAVEKWLQRQMARGQ
jgi:hypothetical protein